MGLIQYEIPAELHARWKRVAPDQTPGTMKGLLIRALTTEVERAEGAHDQDVAAMGETARTAIR